MTPVDYRTCEVGDAASLELHITPKLVEEFATFTGDHNPLHMDDEFAGARGFRRRVVHGMAYGSFLSRLIGMDLPGAGALWTEQAFRFVQPVFIGDVLQLRATVTEVSRSTGTLRLAAEAVNQLGDVVMSGDGQVLVLEAPADDAAPTDADPVPLTVVTGASRGIGAAIARRLAADGHQVVLTYRSGEADARRLADELRAGGARAEVVRYDTADGEAGDRALAAWVLSHVGVPTGLVLNAGAELGRRPIDEVSWTGVQEQIDLYVRPAFNLLRALAEPMAERGGGSVVAIGTSALDGPPPSGMLPYVMAKQAVLGLVRSAAVELGPRRIRVNMVSPGMIATDFNQHLPPRALKVAAMQSPLRRLATVDDVASAVSFLCGDDARYVSGHNLIVSGGAVIR
jgi:3-oxoacyl-[acyl-carrier protein] reductase